MQKEASIFLRSDILFAHLITPLFTLMPFTNQSLTDNVRCISFAAEGLGLSW
jgi:hypothetical protein